MGQLPLSGWWTQLDGYVFNDANRNGKKDAGETGIPNFTLTLRKQDNSLMDRGSTTAITDATGHYSFEGAYPLAAWMVMEAYNDSFYTTGVTYQADNQPTPTTVKGRGRRRQHAEHDRPERHRWTGACTPTTPAGANGIDPRNGGIVGSVSYDTTRNELDPRYAAAEDWQPGISDVPVELHAPVDCGDHAGAALRRRRLLPARARRLLRQGQAAQHLRLRALEPAHRLHRPRPGRQPAGPQGRQRDGLRRGRAGAEPGDRRRVHLGDPAERPVRHLPTDQGTPDANFGAAVDGNYGFGDGCITAPSTRPTRPTRSAPAGPSSRSAPVTTWSRSTIPDDLTGHPMYKVTGEEDINIAHGDQIVPQVPPPACAGALHTVDVAGDGTDGYPALAGDGTNGAPVGVDGACLEPGRQPDLRRHRRLAVRGQGQAALRHQAGRRSTTASRSCRCSTCSPTCRSPRACSASSSTTSTTAPTRAARSYGEKPGIPFAPVGIYDFANRLVHDRGVRLQRLLRDAAAVHGPHQLPHPVRRLHRDVPLRRQRPRRPGRAERELQPALPHDRHRVRGDARRDHPHRPGSDPGGLDPDLAHHRSRPRGLLPGRRRRPAAVRGVQALRQRHRRVHHRGHRLRREPRAPARSPSTATALPTTAWSDTTIQVTVPAGTPTGTHTLRITADNGKQTVNGLTFHVLGAGYNPTVREVGPGHAVRHDPGGPGRRVRQQRRGRQPGRRLPRTNATAGNPRGAYYENLVMASPVKLQGVGPGGFQGGTYVPGTVLDAGAFGGDTAPGDRLVHQGRRPHLGRQPERQRRRGDLPARLGRRRHRGRSGAQLRRRLPRRDRRVRHPRRRPAGLPGQHQRPDRPAHRPAGQHHHPGRRGLRQRLRQEPADHQQRGAEQRRRLRHHPDRHPRPARLRRQPAQRGRADRGQPHHLQRGHQPRGRHRPVRRQRRLRGRPATTSAATSPSSTAPA